MASASSLLLRKLLLPGSSSRTVLLRRPSVIVHRFKHGAKRGQHLKRLEEVANSQEHEFGIERRQKKKEKLAAKKAGEAPPQSHNADEDSDFDSDDEDEEEEPSLPDPQQIKERMQKHIEAFKVYLKGVRGSEPSPEMFDDISVADAYGKGTGSTPLKSVAQVVITSSTQATATCFDPTVSKAVVEAIQKNLNLNPQKDDGGVIRIPLPRPSKELRLETVKGLHHRAEMFRVRLRQVRSKSLKKVRQGVAGHLEGISKDDAFRIQEEVERIADEMNHQITVLSDEKERTVMQI